MRRSTAPAIVSALAALLLYVPTLRYGFVWDDVSLIAENRYLADPEGKALLPGTRGQV